MYFEGNVRIDIIGFHGSDEDRCKSKEIDNIPDLRIIIEVETAIKIYDDQNYIY